MSTGLFYCGVQVAPEIKIFIDKLQEYSDKYAKSVYVINKALGKNLKIDSYEYTKEVVILIPKQKIMLLNYGKPSSDFDEFVEDFISDLEYLSKKYEYQNKLGRSRNWKDCISELQFKDILTLDIKDILHCNNVPVHKERTVELLISLLIGSINNIHNMH